MNAALRSAPDRRLAALALTALVHALLLLGWRASRHLPRLPAVTDPPGIQWIDLRPRVPDLPRPPQAHPRAPAPAPARVHADAPVPAEAIHVPSAPAVTTAPAAPAPSAPASPAAGPGGASAAAPADAPEGPLLQNALRAAGSVDKALRKENRAYITAPLDSPQMRMERGMEAAHDAVPPKLWEAPRVDELVNNTGDGARRTRIVTGNGTMCETDRATNTSIDMIEKHGKRRFTNCPEHESPASAQAWRTARD